MRNLIVLGIIVFTLFLSFYGCGTKEIYINIPFEHIPVYKKGDVLIYKSGDKYDTFVFYDLSINYIVTENIHTQDILYSARNKKDTNLYGTVTLQPDVTFVYWLNYLMFFEPGQKPDTSSITINGYVYNDVYVHNILKTDTMKVYATKIYFTYKNWIIRYLKNDSTTWDLVQH